jgi:hypothetical protein
VACLGGLSGTIADLCPFPLGQKYAKTPCEVRPISFLPFTSCWPDETQKATKEATTAALTVELPLPAGGSGGGRLDSSRPTPQWLRDVERKGIPHPITVSSSSLHTVRVRLAGWSASPTRWVWARRLARSRHHAPPPPPGHSTSCHRPTALLCFAMAMDVVVSVALLDWFDHMAGSPK